MPAGVAEIDDIVVAAVAGRVVPAHHVRAETSPRHRCEYREQDDQQSHPRWSSAQPHRSGNFKHDRRTLAELSRTECRIMVKAPALLLLSLALAGCAMAPQARLAPDPAFTPARYAWDGAGEDPNRVHSAAGPSRTTRAAARPERDNAQDHTDQDARVNRSLVICQGCLRQQPQPEDARLARAAD
ncbi:hypothetical protein [Bradyrhizobium sp. McL0616]|uniref:hypothetical protein n=1 Tax=Bradyrhizobium sp. McL0616 TaxID=3415674 RepID=UPI003CED56E7